jgi:hypothetical protein
LLGFLDEDAFRNDAPLSRDVVAPYVIRTEKRQAIDAQGQPLFKPRRTVLHPVAWDEGGDQHALYEAVSEYVRLGYNQARVEKRNAVGFLMLLMQRLVPDIVCDGSARRRPGRAAPSGRPAFLPRRGHQ